MPGGSRSGGGLEYKPFKMRGAPMQRNFGIGMENQGENTELINALQNEDAAKATADAALESAITGEVEAPTKDLTTVERSGEAAAKRHNKNYQRTGGGEQHQKDMHKIKRD
tara:strand:+ start:931 stop:1263 length:333 start_codon:yes stop_codon:yes gene_type:complete